MSPAAIEAALSEWIAASGVPTDQLILRGDVPQRRSHLQVRGGAAAPARAMALFRALMTSAGFRTFTGYDTGGVNTPAHAGSDKSRSKHDWNYKLSGCSASSRTPTKWWLHLDRQSLAWIRLRGL
eukprot:4724934-Pyramimonas_sp.AAC.1